MSPKISVIVDNYNYARFLARTIDSVLAQDYPDVELIVVDDGSTDDSRSIIERYGGRLLAIFQENGGQASAFNAGFARSSGGLVLFLDSDDVLWPDCLSEVTRRWRLGLSKLHFNLEFIDAEDRRIGKTFFKPPLPAGDLRANALATGIVESMPTSGNVFSREFLETVMPVPEAAWRRGPDVYLFNVAALAGETAAIDKPLGGYRVHGLNMSSVVRGIVVNLYDLKVLLERERQTDLLLTESARKLGLEYRAGTLTTSFAHLQQLVIYQKLSRGAEEIAPAELNRTFLAAASALFAWKATSLRKRVALLLWTLCVFLAPRAIAEKLVVMGYRRGAVVSAPRFAFSNLTSRS
jgi:glycosyltransferase involved in cell wall biosynthesis